MKEPFTPMNLAIVQLEALDILTTSYVKFSYTVETINSGETPLIDISFLSVGGGN